MNRNSYRCEYQCRKTGTACTQWPQLTCISDVIHASALETYIWGTFCRKALVSLRQKSRANQLLPEDVEPLCRDGALTYLHNIVGPGVYLNLLPDSHVEAEAPVASGIMQSWQWTHKSITSFVSFCLRNCTPQWGYDQCLEPFHSAVSEGL